MAIELEETQPASRESSPQLPALISRFEVERTLGAGGNGVVMLARDPTLDRNVAIKILRRRDDADASQRLLREAQAAAKLTHEAVVVVHEVGTHDGQVYVAMEHVAGGTLTAWQRGKSWREVLETYVRAGRGLAAAHAAGMVHRDFKPDNVLVGDDGRVRVTDFGLVSVSAGKPPDDARDLELTKTGTVMGTPRYMAPEQHLGEAVDPRTDQFAFCVALYEALWGRPPFEGETYGALADHVLAGEVVPPPSSGVPPPVRAAVLRGLARTPEHRFPTMTALLAELTRRSPRRWRWIVPAMILAAAAAAFALVAAVPRHGHTDTAHEAFDRGQAAFKRGDYAAAAAEFRHAFALDPDLDGRSAPFVFNMAASYKMLGNCPEAIKGFREYLAIAKDPDDVARVEQEIRACGSDTSTGSADDAYRAGEQAYEKQDFATAVVEWKRGFAIEPDLSNKGLAYLYNMGQAYRQMGNCAEASFAFKRYLALKTDLGDGFRKEIQGLIEQLEACAAQHAGSGGSATR